MANKRFELNDNTISIIEEIGGHMPGGFFIYQAEEPETLIYANKAVFDIYGCANQEEFRALTGFTFRGMVHPEDYSRITASIVQQIEVSDDKLDYAEYRIIRKDGSIRWVDDYGHYAETKAYGGIYVVFISDITEKREKREMDTASRDAVIDTLTNNYNTVWLINDVVTEKCSLFHTDMDTVHAEAIHNALSHSKYTETKTEYVATMVAKEDQARMQEQISLPYILEQFKTKRRFAVTFLRALESGPRYYRIHFGKVYMPGGRTGVTMGFIDVDDEVRRDRALEQALAEGKKAEEENRRLLEEMQSAARLAELMGSVSSLLTNMPAMSFSKDSETGVYLACNQAFAEYAGKARPEDVIGLTDHEIFDAETATHFVEDDKKALAMDQAYVFFEDVPDATGTVFHNLQTTKLKFRDASGRLCLLGMCVDVTEMARIKSAEAESRAKQEALEEKLLLQERLLQEKRSGELQNQLITALGSDYWSVYLVHLDKDEGICYQESGEEKDFKIGQRFPYMESIRAYARNSVTDEYRDEFLKFTNPDAIREGLRKQRVISYRYKINKEGKALYVMIRFAGVRHPEDRDDGLVHSVGLSFSNVDAETRNSLEQNHILSEALAAAEQANRAKTSFLSNMSHEIRTPMNAIIGLNNIAMNEPTASDRVKEYLAKIGTSAQHLLGIINDILDMSRIESGRMVIKAEEFSFAKSLEQVNTIVGGQCRDKGLHYECVTHGTIDDYYVGDAMKLKQVMINILGNAVKFTPEGGKIGLILERREGSARVSVMDTGIGIGNVREYIRKEIGKEVDTVILTHGHLDHASGAVLFQDLPIYLNEKDRDLMNRHVFDRQSHIDYTVNGYKRMGWTCPDFSEEDILEGLDSSYTRKLNDHDVFDLGGISVEMIYTPGHTQGMMMALFREERIILFGDACGVGVLLVEDCCSTVEEYRETLRKVKAYDGTYDRIIRNHGTCESPLTLLDNVIDVCTDILEGRDDRIPSSAPIPTDYPVFMAKATLPGSQTRVDGKEGNIIYASNKIR